MNLIQSTLLADYGVTPSSLRALNAVLQIGPGVGADYFADFEAAITDAVNNGLLVIKSNRLYPTAKADLLIRGLRTAEGVSDVE